MSGFREYSGTFTLHLDADAERAWGALTTEMGTWWSCDLTALGGRMELEPWLGGRLFETTEDAGGALWGTVGVIVPGKKVVCFGELSPDFGGPARTCHSFEVALHGGGGSTLTYKDHVWGAVSEGLGATLIEGWKGILGGLQSHLKA
jgi:hypothetical protein